MKLVKKHVKKHKAAYISGGSGLLFAGITVLIMRERHAGVQSMPDGLAKVTVRSLNFLSNQHNIVNVIEREGRGHPGYIVRCIETGNVYLSQEEVAKAMNTYPSVVSNHLTGKISDIYGLHFARIAA